MPRVPKEHLCQKCGDTEGSNFYSNRKSECRKCFLAKSNSRNHISLATVKYAETERAKAKSRKKFTPVPTPVPTSVPTPVQVVLPPDSSIEDLSKKIDELNKKLILSEKRSSNFADIVIEKMKEFSTDIYTNSVNVAKNREYINAITSQVVELKKNLPSKYHSVFV